MSHLSGHRKEQVIMCIPEHDELAYQLFIRGRQAIQSGAIAEAIQSLEISAKLDPHFKTLHLLGECLVREGKLREAIVPLAAASTLNCQPGASALLAEIFLKMGDLTMSSQIIERVLKEHPSYRKALSLRSELAKRQL